MEKIIGGKRYNTETAALVGCWDNGLNRDDIEWKRETLYKKRGGEYFIFGEGGSTTRYAGRVSIIPIDYDQAQAWVLRHLDKETYKREFVSSGDSEPVNFLVRAPKDVVDKYKRLMAQRGLTSGELLAELLKTIY